MPPGTGEVASTRMARKVNVAVSGVIENMSWFTGNDSVRYELFGSGGGELLAQQLGVPLLGQVRLVTALREGSDEGRPIVATHPGGEAARAVDALRERSLGAATRRNSPPLLNCHATGGMERRFAPLAAYAAGLPITTGTDPPQRADRVGTHRRRGMNAATRHHPTTPVRLGAGA